MPAGGQAKNIQSMLVIIQHIQTQIQTTLNFNDIHLN